MQKIHGDMAFPHPTQYFWAAHLARVVDWCCDHDSKLWVHIKQSCMNIQLPCLPWTELSFLGPLRSHPLIGAVPKVLHQLLPSFTADSNLSCLHLTFPPDLLDTRLQSLLRSGTFKFCDFISRLCLQDLSDISMISELALDTW